MNRKVSFKVLVGSAKFGEVVIDDGKLAKLLPNIYNHFKDMTNLIAELTFHVVLYQCIITILK